MPEFLKSPVTIHDKIEELILGAAEYVHLISPYLYYIPASINQALKKANGKNIKVTVIYKKGLVSHGKEVEKLNLANLSVYSHEQLHAKAYFNEKEAIITSFNLSGNEGERSIEYGIYFTREESPEAFDSLLNDSMKLLADCREMKIEDSRLVEKPVIRAVPPVSEIKPIAAEGLVADPDKKLTPKERQNLLLRIFSTEYKECAIKVEDSERLRVQGSGIVLFTNKQRTEVIFVRYDAYKSQLEEIKEFITSRHPDLPIWFNYNRITLNVEKAPEIISLFATIKAAVTAFNLV